MHSEQGSNSASLTKGYIISTLAGLVVVAILMFVTRPSSAARGPDPYMDRVVARFSDPLPQVGEQQHFGGACSHHGYPHVQEWTVESVEPAPDLPAGWWRVTYNGGGDSPLCKTRRVLFCADGFTVKRAKELGTCRVDAVDG